MTERRRPSALGPFPVMSCGESSPVWRGGFGRPATALPGLLATRGTSENHTRMSHADGQKISGSEEKSPGRSGSKPRGSQVFRSRGPSAQPAPGTRALPGRRAALREQHAAMAMAGESECLRKASRMITCNCFIDAGTGSGKNGFLIPNLSISLFPCDLRAF